MPNKDRNKSNKGTAPQQPAGNRKHIASSEDFDQLAREAEKEQRTLKPGESQGSGSKRHNNGRGGGK